jgi:hypothetical protein
MRRSHLEIYSFSIAAPAAAKLSSNDNTSTQDIQILAKFILGERSNIFNLSVESGKLILRAKY